jgi:hypothetical protein
MVCSHDDHWRPPQDPPLPERRDHQTCRFHTAPPVWHGEPLKPIVDHHQGVNIDLRPEHLQLLGPNGAALHHETRSGANTGRTEKALSGVAKVDRHGTRHDVRPAEPGLYVTSAAGKDAQSVIAADAQERRR